MSQHYSVSWKKGLAALCLLAVAGLSGCDQKENAAGKVEYDGLSNSQPLRVDANNHTVTMLGNDSNLLIVFYVQIMPDDFVMQLHRF